MSSSSRCFSRKLHTAALSVSASLPCCRPRAHGKWPGPELCLQTHGIVQHQGYAKYSKQWGEPSKPTHFIDLIARAGFQRRAFREQPAAHTDSADSFHSNPHRDLSTGAVSRSLLWQHSEAAPGQVLEVKELPPSHNPHLSLMVSDVSTCCVTEKQHGQGWLFEHL